MSRVDRDTTVRIATRAVLPALLLAVTPALAAPQRLAVVPPSGADVSASFVERTSGLLARGLRGGGHTVTETAGPPTARPPGAKLAAELAREVGADAAVLIHVGRFPPLTTVRVRVHVAGTGAMIYEDDASTNGGPEALDALVGNLAARMAARLEHGLQAVAPPPGPEPGGARPARPSLFVGARFSALVPLTSADGSASPLSSAGVALHVDLEHVMFEFWAETSARDEKGRGFRSLGPGVYVRLAEAPLPIHAGAGVQYTLMQLGGSGATGLRVQPAVGLTVAALESFKAVVQLGYFVNLFEEHEPLRLRPGGGASYLSHGPAVSLGGYFR